MNLNVGRLLSLKSNFLQEARLQRTATPTSTKRTFLEVLTIVIGCQEKQTQKKENKKLKTKKKEKRKRKKKENEHTTQTNWK